MMTSTLLFHFIISFIDLLIIEDPPKPPPPPPKPIIKPPAPQPPIQDPEADKDIKNKGKQRTITRWGHCTDFNELEALEIQ